MDAIGELLAAPTAGPWTAYLLDVGLEGLILTSAALALTALLRGASASVRHRLWALAFAGLVALPLLSAALPAWRVPVLPEGVVPAATGGPPSPEARDAVDRRTDPAAGAAAGGETPAVARDPGAEAAAAGPDTEGVAAAGGRGSGAAAGATSSGPAATPSSKADQVASPISVWQILLAVWITGTVGLLGRLAVSHLAAWRIRRRATPLHHLGWKSDAWHVASRLGLGRPVRLLRSARVSVPGVWGFRRPALLLPPEAEEWSEERRRVVLLHELAHVKRRDCVVQLLADVARALHWPNPLVWVGARRLLSERERACDEVVISAGTRRTDYAGHLLDVARSGAGRSPRLGWAGVAMARPSELEGRLLAILNGDGSGNGPGAGRHAATGAFTALAALFLPLAAFQAAPVGTAGADGTAGGNDAAPAVGPVEAFEPGPAEGSAARPEAADDAAATRERAAADRAVADRPGRWGGDARAAREAGTGTERTGAGEPGPSVTPDLSASARGQEADTTVRVRVMRAMAGALEDEDAGVRRQAAHALGSSERPEAVEPLSRALRNDPVAEVRRQAAWGLGMIEDPAGVDALTDAAGDEDAGVRRQVAWALGMIEDASGVPALRPALEDPDAEVRRQAAWALGMIEDPSAADPLSEAMEDTDAGVRSQAAWALGMVEDAAGVDALVRALRSDAEAEVRRQAAWALGMIEDETAAEALIDAFEADEDPGVRKQAMWALSMVMGGD